VISRTRMPNRKPTRLSTSLQRDLTRYALAAGAAGVSLLSPAMPSEAEIVHTKVDRVIGRGQSYGIDLNHDGIVDFSMHNISNRCTRTFDYCPAVEIVAYPANGNEIEYGVQHSYAAALRSGAVIGSGAPMNNAQESMADEFRSSGVFYHFGSWINVENRFLGLSFQINGETHYGWARLTVHSPEKYQLTAFLRDFAYETEANAPIEAGATSGDDSAVVDSGEESNQLGVFGASLGELAVGSRASGLKVLH
jgi:hypothetical protein